MFNSLTLAISGKVDVVTAIEIQAMVEDAPATAASHGQEFLGHNHRVQGPVILDCSVRGNVERPLEKGQEGRRDVRHERNVHRGGVGNIRCAGVEGRKAGERPAIAGKHGEVLDHLAITQVG